MSMQRIRRPGVVTFIGAIILIQASYRTHPHSAYMTSGLVTLLIGVFVIWALYGHKESEEYFESS
jgi:general stress protein CsbA